MIKSRVMIAAMRSDSGKTIFTCGLLNLLKGMEHRKSLMSFKCGPDYIDPMFHRRVLGVEGDNLDSFFSSPEEIRRILFSHEKENSVLEGVMGIYDGVDPEGLKGSSYEIASITKTPIILLVDYKGLWTTGLSMIKGIIMDDKEKLIKGIVLNRLGSGYRESIEREVEKMLLNIRPDIKLLGSIPNNPGIRLDSRHLGLLMPDEIQSIQKQIEDFTYMIQENLDVDGLLEIMDLAEELAVIEPRETAFEPGNNSCNQIHKSNENEVAGLRLAVAWDEAFCFYYMENLRAFMEHGIEIVEFSPLHDKALPEKIQGILLGGGYPELYADKLSENTQMREAILKALKGGLPSLAECGGFMYLGSSIVDKDGREYPMVGIIEAKSENQGKLTRFGYLSIERKSKEGLLSDGVIKGHEFHYFDTDNNGGDCIATKAKGGSTWECMHAGKNHLWGFPHLYYRSNITLVRNFKHAMMEYKKNG